MATKQVGATLKEPYARVLIPEEDGTYSAEILELPGCFAQGTTAEDAIRNLDEAARQWIEAARKQGQEIPEPSAARGFSGTFSLRLPKSLHRRAARYAHRNGASLNQYLVATIASSVGADDLYDRIVRKLAQYVAGQMTVHFTSVSQMTIKQATTINATLSLSGANFLAPGQQAVASTDNVAAEEIR